MIDLRGSITIAVDGDVAGHEFHGNQHTGGSSANKSVKASKEAHTATKQAVHYQGTNEQKAIIHERAQKYHDKAAKLASKAFRDKNNTHEQRTAARAAYREHQQLSAGHGKMLDKLGRAK